MRSDRIGVHYQPLFDIGSGRLAGIEALVRVTDGDRVILPARFIDIAEETGLIVRFGAPVLHEACRQEAAWVDHLGVAAPPRIAVNVSAHQLLHGDLMEVARGALADTGLDADRLDLEITETAFMAAIGSVVKTLEQLRELGVHIGIDDFGTGYASLTYLKHLPADFVKVDGSFVHEMTDHEVDVPSFVPSSTSAMPWA